MNSFSHPRALAATDRVAEFTCGSTELDAWLRDRAVKNETTGASRTFVSIERRSGRIAGYYCLSSSSLVRDEAAGGLRRNMPDPVPVILLGRLAVDTDFAGAGLGASLLQDAVLKGLAASHIIGARAFLVHALNDSAEAFYRRFGFTRMPPTSRRAMYLLMADAEATVQAL